MFKHHYKNLLILSFLVVFYALLSVPSSPAQTIPTYHWSYDYLEQLKLRGYLNEINFSHRPFLFKDIHQNLPKIKPSHFVENLLNQHIISSILFTPLLKSANANFSSQLFIGNNLNRQTGQDIWVNRFVPRGRILFNYKDNLSVVNTVLTDNRLDDDPQYLGKRQSGAASFMEEAFILYTPDHFNFLLGRSFLRWGPGQTGTLLLSDNSRPLDQLYADFHYKWLRFSFVTTTLNTRNDSGFVASRYLSAHRLDIHPLKNLWLGISEAILYGGENKAPELAYHNPVIFYHGVQLNGPTTGNTLGSIDFSYYPVRNLHFYGELLIDDIQLEKTGPGDLEPNEWGLLIGAQGAYRRFFWETEYVRVTNRTYKTPYFYERYTHRNEPLGYYLGDDFDHLWFRGNYWLTSSLRLQTKLQFIRLGEGRIYTPFDTPWMNTPIGQNYSEPFPTGVVEKTQRFQLELRWHPSKFGFGEFILGHESIRNFQNKLNSDYKGWYSQIKIWMEFDRSWGT